MTDKVTFAVGGPVQAKAGTYLKRPADEALFKACQAGEFAYVLACRQIGKSSLMFETAKKLRQNGIRTAIVDLNEIGKIVTSQDQWYFSLIDNLARGLGLDIDVGAWWQAKPDLSTSTQRFLRFFREVVLQQIPKPIVIFVDEIDSTLGLDFTDDFFAAIRTIYNERAEEHPIYQGLTFVLLGVATPDELIVDSTRTPFNIGQEIILDDFTKEECQPFHQTIMGKYPHQGRRYFDQIYTWTKGHPYLTQKLCRAVVEASEPDQPKLVDNQVRELFIAPEAYTEDNLYHVRKVIDSDPQVKEILSIYKQVLQAEPVLDNERSVAINKLKLYGLVVVKNRLLEVRNKIYAQVFDISWVEETLQRKAGVGLPSPYKIVQKIGQGGFATVYLAEFTSNSGETAPVAVKMLNPGDGSEQERAKLIRRFEREARAAAQLNHPNIIRILDTGRNETGHGDEQNLFITMEYIAGGTLREKLKDGPLPRQEAFDIVKQIGAALSYAHEQGIIHRDVNPNNILLDTDAEKGRAVLSDFGLVKILEEDHHSHTLTDSPIGTYRYMAPEQWRHQPSTPRTDIYALAITFFEMLAGQYPFRYNSSFDLRDKHLDESLPPLSDIAPKPSSFFDDILIKAAAKEPAKRFQSVAEFIAALEDANSQAEEIERENLRTKVLDVFEIAQDYVIRGNYKPERALDLIEDALELDPNLPEALSLKGEMKFEQNLYLEGIKYYQQAYEHVHDPASEVGQAYLKALDKMGQHFLKHQAYQQSLEYYETIKQILETDQIKSEGRKNLAENIWQEALTNLADFFQSQKPEFLTLNAFKGDIDETLKVLKRFLQLLDELEDTNKRNHLKGKLERVKIEGYRDIIATEEKIINETLTQNEQDEIIFEHYEKIDQAYQALIRLEPEPSQWVDERRKKQKEQAELRLDFVGRALANTSNYVSALRHYQAIHTIEQAGYPTLSTELKLDLTKIIPDLQKKADLNGKYLEIRRLMSQNKLQEAWQKLNENFISKGFYDYEDVPKLGWELAYAIKHGGQLPFGWDGVTYLEAFGDRAADAERKRIKYLLITLAPWSNFSKKLAEEFASLSTYEQKITEIETKLSQVEAQGRSIDIEPCQQQLSNIKRQLQIRQEQLQIISSDLTPQLIEDWIEKVNKFDAEMQRYHIITERHQILKESDPQLEDIEENRAFTYLQTVGFTALYIKYKIAQVQLMLQLYLDRIQKADVSALQQEVDKFEKRRKINLYLISISWLLAVVVGKLYFNNMPSTLALIALPAFILCSGYLVLIHLFPKVAQILRRDKW